MQDYLIETVQPHLLTPAQMDELADAVREAFVWYAPGSTNTDIFALLRGRGASYVDLVQRGGRTCGFLASEEIVYGSIRVCFHHGVSILESERGRGLYVTLATKALSRGDFDLLIARTQNPRVYQALARFAGGAVFPNLEGRLPSPEVVEIARDLSGRKGFESDSLIVRGAHHFVREDRSFRFTRSKEIERLFERHLGRDDGYMVVVELR